VDVGGHVYVTDQSNHRVQKFDASGNFILMWGRRGRDDGEFMIPYGILKGPTYFEGRGFTLVGLEPAESSDG